MMRRHLQNTSDRLRTAQTTDSFMSFVWLLFILSGLALGAVLIYKVITFKNQPVEVEDELVCKPMADILTPERGDILDYKGRILATSTILYSVRFDPLAVKDSVWNKNYRELARELAKLYEGRPSAACGKNKKTSATTEDWIRYLEHARNPEHPNRFLNIRNEATQLDVTDMRRMPIFNLKKGESGYIEKNFEKRIYPYGRAARRTLGFVVTNKDTCRKKGIEGVCDSLLHGKDGRQITSRSDEGRIPMWDRRNTKAVNGESIRTTLDIDIQNIAEDALRASVEKSELIEMSSVIVMDTKSGAIRAMANLGRDSKGRITENGNFSLINCEAPGSVFKGAVLMALLEEGYITSVDQEIPTYGGEWTYNGKLYNDKKHVGIQRFPSGRVKISEAFEMSANNPFRQLLCDQRHFGNNPARFIKKIKSFGIVDTIDFDIYGGTPPFILDPSMKRMSKMGSWDGQTLPGMAIGYGMNLPPLNIVTFYNAIANDGKMMKPYIFDAILNKDGEVVKQYTPTIMHESICTATTARKLKEVMGRVTTNKNGTAYEQLHDAICPIAGKTGTAQRVFKNSKNKNVRHDGKIESQQATFVGFFPSDKPQYTAIVILWCKPSEKNFFGATYAAPVFRTIADKIYCLNEI